MTLCKQQLFGYTVSPPGRFLPSLLPPMAGCNTWLTVGQWKRAGRDGGSCHITPVPTVGAGEVDSVRQTPPQAGRAQAQRHYHQVPSPKRHHREKDLHLQKKQELGEGERETAEKKREERRGGEWREKQMTEQRGATTRKSRHACGSRGR